MTRQIISNISHTYEINKSKFICVLCPFHKFKETMEQLREEHPKGSSGPPTLAVLRGEELIESAAIIVRYFGGIKLGVGGLIRAYGKSVHLALEEAKEAQAIQIYIKQVEAEYKIEIQNLGKFEHFLKSYQDLIIEKEFLGLEVIFKIKATDSEQIELERFLDKLLYS